MSLQDSSGFAALPLEMMRRLDAWLAEFDRNWHERRLAADIPRLPPGGDPLRLPLLTGLVRVDMAQHWRRARRPAVEAYLRLYPELAASDEVVVALVLAEYAMRQQFVPPADTESFVRRFPRHAAQIRQAMLETLSPATPDGTNDSKGPGGPAYADLPETFGRYRIVTKLGRGGMGTVYLAHDTQLDRAVALKVPRLDAPLMIERFLREARAAATISHANICPVYDVGQHDGVHFVTMAYVDGKSLATLLQEGGPLPQRPVAAVVRKVARAMHAAHEKGVIHRDLKPANILVNQANEPIVMDFGLAFRLDKESPRMPGEGVAVGTPAYMPPEQMSGDHAAIGPRSDVWSLGVILYELLTGRRPFEGSRAEIVTKVLTGAPGLPRELRPDLEPALEIVCLQALCKRPEDRFDSMAELAEALTQFLRSTPPAED